jgi:hypothetical protein
MWLRHSSISSKILIGKKIDRTHMQRFRPNGSESFSFSVIFKNHIKTPHIATEKKFNSEITELNINMLENSSLFIQERLLV